MRVLAVLLALLAGCGAERLARDPAMVARPWDPGRPSIYVSGQVPVDEGFAPGAVDGIFARRGGDDGGDPEAAAAAVRLLRAAIGDMTAARLRALYDQLAGEDAAAVVDGVIAGVGELRFVDQVRIDRLATWLAEYAPDREPVKLALALLILHADAHRDLLMALGRHEELTRYAAIGLTGTTERDRNLFELAKAVHGWGRVETVELLAETGDPEIRAWMLRGGCRNDVSYEDLAYTCATAGGLRAALEPETVDDELVAGAGELLLAMIHEDIDDYDDAPRVAERYLDHLGPQPVELESLLVVHAIGEWSPALRERCRAVERQPYWKDLIAVGLADADPAVHARAEAAAAIVGG